MLLVDRAACTEYAGLSHRSADETSAEVSTAGAKLGAGAACQPARPHHACPRAPALPEV